METLDYFRIFNISLTVVAVIINLIKGWHLKLHRVMDLDAQMRFLANMAWCLTYIVAATIAASQDANANLWIIFFGVPIIWTLIAGVVGWPLAERRKRDERPRLRPSRVRR